MASRTYRDSFENQTVAAVMDLFYIKNGTGNGCCVRAISLSAGAVTASAEIRLRLKRLPATVTAGSGGASSTAVKTDSKNGTASAATARQRDTTQATTSGTAATLAVWQWNVLGEFNYVPPTPEQRESADVSEAIVFDIVGTPASTVLSGWIEWEEYP
jgi:hypothetical protein